MSRGDVSARARAEGLVGSSKEPDRSHTDRHLALPVASCPPLSTSDASSSDSTSGRHTAPRGASRVPAPRNPTEMTPAERLREISELFARSYLRLLLSREERRKGVAESREPERPWTSVVDTTENDTQEVT